MSGPIVCCGEASLFLPHPFVVATAVVGKTGQSSPLLHFILTPLPASHLCVSHKPFSDPLSLCVSLSLLHAHTLLLPWPKGAQLVVCFSTYTTRMACPHLVKLHPFSQPSPPHTIRLQALPSLSLLQSTNITFKSDAHHFHYLPLLTPILSPFTLHVFWGLDFLFYYFNSLLSFGIFCDFCFRLGFFLSFFLNDCMQV